jgi:Zn-dependent protease
MEAQIKLGRIFGVEIGLHYSWLIIALLIAFSLAGHFGGAHPHWDQGMIWGMAIVTSLLFFAAIVAHELSHAMVARWRGLPVHSITLFALGGVAQLDKEPQNDFTRSDSALPAHTRRAEDVTSCRFRSLERILAATHSNPIVS